MKKRLLSMLLVLIMVSSMTVGVLADTVVEELPNGTSTVTTDTVTDPVTGAETTTTKTVVDVDNPDGSTYDKTETNTVTEIVDESGAVVGAFTVIEGQETTVSENKVDVTVELVPGKTTTGSAGGSDPVTTGDRKNGEDDRRYDETTITKTEKEVTAHTGKVEVSLGDNETLVGELKPLETQIIDKYNDEGFVSERDLSKRFSYENNPWKYIGKETEQPDGYDFKHAGVAQMSKWLTQMSNGTGGAFHHRLENESQGEQTIFYAYCIDMANGAYQNHWYRIDNLEDAGYFDEDDADKIRAIVTNGYWGTASEQNEAGEETSLGSLAKIKQDMKQAITDGDLASGDLTAEEMELLVDGLTEGLALNATQAAIWTYANGAEVDTLLATYKEGAASEEEKAAANLMYQYLIGLDPVEENPNNTTEIIDQYSIQDLSIVIGDKLTNGQVKVEGEQTVENDTYAASVSFALVVKTDNKDNLVVKVMSADGTETLAEVRLAGEANDGIPMIYPDENGNYVISGLEIAENEEVSFNLTLEGTQYLEQGVYIYTPEGETRGSSQTLVGIAEGTKEVNVTASVSVEFEVEDGVVRTERRWHREGDPARQPVNHPNPPTEEILEEDPPLEDQPPVEEPYEEIFEEDPPLTVIEDDPIPLASVPQTGDSSLLFVAMTILSGSGLAGLALTKKREDEE